jgi:hypothetical protein
MIGLKRKDGYSMEVSYMNDLRLSVWSGEDARGRLVCWSKDEYRSNDCKFTKDKTGDCESCSIQNLCFISTNCFCSLFDSDF